MEGQEPPDRREGHAYRPLAPAAATPGGGRLWERFYRLIEQPTGEDRPALWVLAWVVLPLLLAAVAIWLSAPLALLFEGPEWSWPGFVIALALAAAATLLLVRPAVRRLGESRGLHPAAAASVSAWSTGLCIAAAVGGAASGQSLDNGLVLVVAIAATVAAVLVVAGLRARVEALYLAGMTLAWTVIVVALPVSILALVRAGACAVGDCL